MLRALTEFMRSSHGSTGTVSSPPQKAAALETAQDAMLACVQDCPSDELRKLTQRIYRAPSHKDLWALRGDAYCLIARTHCQSEAGARVSGLTPLFEGWVKPVHLKQGSQYSPGARM